MKNRGEKKTILVIDDSKPIRVLIWKTFDNIFNVLLEGKVSEALKTLKMRCEEIRLIILDYEMPEMNGDEFYSYIKRYCPQVPVIVLSGSLSKERIERMRLIGLKHFLSKPINIKRLRNEIGKIIDIEKPGT